MYLYIYIIASLIYLIILLSGRVKHLLHMLQLNSYYNSRYGSYLAKNPGEIFSVLMLVPLCGYAFLLLDKTLSAPVCAFVMLHLLFDKKYPKAKKPLVITARVKRQTVTCAVIIAALLFGAYFCGKYALIAMLAINLLTPFVVMAANLINAPVENSIKLKFYNRAKKTLESMPDLTIVGVTGSFGKTSVKNFLYALLAQKYNVCMTPGNFNTTVGVVRTVNENLRAKDEIFIVEMGAKNVGDIKEICDLVHPDYGIVTAIGEQHLETFKSIENIVKTKLELADAATKGVFLNADNEYLAASKYANGAVLYGTSENAAYRAMNIKSGPSGSSFTLKTPKGDFEMQTRLLGVHNVINLAGAAAVAMELGVDAADVAVAVRRIESVAHRLEVKESFGVTIIDDAYNSNPVGSKRALEVLSGFEGCRILVTPGMVELGAKEYELNREFGVSAAKSCDYMILVGEKQSPPIREGALSAGFDENRLYVAKDINDAFAYMRGLNEKDKVVLLENDLPDNFL